MTLGDYSFIVESNPTRRGYYLWVVYWQGQEVKRSDRSFPSYTDTYMRGWLAVNKLQAGIPGGVQSLGEVGK